MPESRTCPSGHPNARDDKFCRSCGQPIAEPDEQTDPPASAEAEFSPQEPLSALHDAGVSDDESSAASESTGDEILALVGIVVAVTCLFAAWLWFGWQYAWIPTAVTGVWLIVLIGLSYSHLRDGDLRLKAKVVGELVLLLTPIVGVGAAGIWSPTGVNFSGSDTDDTYTDDTYTDDTYTDDTYTDDIEIRDTERCKALEDAGDIAYNNGDVGTFGELGSEWAKECLD